MKIKEQGFVLSIDQASNNAGASLWYNGELKATKCLAATSPKDPISKRLQTQVRGLELFLDEHLPADAEIRQILFEGVRARLVLCTVGAFLTPARIQAKLSPKHNFVESTSWKKYAQRLGALGVLAEIKGIPALRQIGFDVDRYGIVSQDVADSILMYLCWRDQ